MSDAEARVRDFLATMERRDLVGAKAFLAPGFTMTFPGNRQFTQLEELVAFGASRYRSCLLYTSPSPRDKRQSRMPSSA